MAVAVLKKSKSTESLGNFEEDLSNLSNTSGTRFTLIFLICFGFKDKRRPSHPNETEGKEAKISYHEAKISVAFHCSYTRTRATGGKKKAWRKKIRKARGGNVKWRAPRLDTGNYSWGSEADTRKARILDVVYNTSNNELVRNQTFVKSAIVQNKTAAAALGKKEGEEGESAADSPAEEAKKSNHLQRTGEASKGLQA
ncbi:hypothetical protein QYF36_022380 [Acer negundo]|nr:hypothetical protein QYF36_022380 [Acer negundo]